MESIEGVTSPLFPQLVLSPDTSVKLPSKPLAHSGSVQLYLILAEKILYIQGFDENEYKERPPLLLRGSLFLKITKPVKIKLINLKFCGTAKTDWPEGIPPKKTEYQETHQLIQHTWPFFNSNTTFNDASKGANIFKPMDPSSATTDEISSFSLEPSLTNRDSSGSLANVLRRAASPSPIRTSRSRSNTAASTLFSHLTGTTSNVLDSTTSNDLQSVRSMETINDPNAIRTFQPGDYIYNFELPIPSSTPESINVTFGNVSYYLEASVERAGAFKTSLLGREIITVVRTPSDSSQEENEPIAIVRDWEDRLRYEIVIASKAVVLNTYLPLAFKLTPLEKIQLHRIRVYLTENLEYYCRHKKIHRLEPTKKYLLLEHKPQEGETSLLGDEEITARELEFQLYVPEKLNEKQKLHPDTSYSNIQSHHWIKICLRLSKPEPTEENPQKRKHYEISIDSPVHVLSPMATHANTLLPSYDQPAQMDYLQNPPQSPNVILVDNSLDALMVSSPILSHIDPDPYYVPPDMHLESNIYKPSNLLRELQSPQAQPFSPVISPEMAALSPNLHSISSPHLSSSNSPAIMARPIHLLRRPSMNPPPFDAETAPPPCDDEPPAYEERDTMKDQSVEEDIGETFAFTGLSPHMPNSIMRATSPAPRSRSTSRLRSVVANNNSSGELRGRAPREPSPLPTQQQQLPVSAKPPLQNRMMPRTAESFLNDMEDDDDEELPQPYISPQPIPTISPTLISPTDQLTPTNEVLSPTSSLASSVHSTSTRETQFEPIGEPLLQSSTATSTADRRPSAGRDRFQSVQSMDITSMYSNNNNTNASLPGAINQARSESIWHPLDSDFTHINNPHLYKKPVFNSSFMSGGGDVTIQSTTQEEQQQSRPTRQMSFGVEQVLESLPLDSSLPQSPSESTIIQQSSKQQQPPPPPVPRHVRSSRSGSSVVSSLNSNNSSATLKSGSSNEENEQVTQHTVATPPETRKLSSTSSSRPALNQDTAF